MAKGRREFIHLSSSLPILRPWIELNDAAHIGEEESSPSTEPNADLFQRHPAMWVTLSP